MKKLLFYILIASSLASCWAPRCPVRDCDVAMEHRHAFPKGTYSGRPLLSKYRFHNVFSKSVRKKMSESGEGQPGKIEKTKRGPKKLFDWERD